MSHGWKARHSLLSGWLDNNFLWKEGKESIVADYLSVSCHYMIRLEAVGSYLDCIYSVHWPFTWQEKFHYF